MPKASLFRIIFVLCLLCLPLDALRAQVSYSLSPRNGETKIREKTLRSDLESLTSERCEGRRSGSSGNFVAATLIRDRFRSLGLQALGEYDNQTFPITPTLAGHNIVGYLPGSGDSYLIIAASYDGLGVLDGTLYPGADSNASGVAALLSLGEAYHQMSRLGKVFSRNIIFVAFDGKQQNLAGSRAFAEALSQGLFTDPRTGKVIREKDITLMVNLDQLGSSLAPPGNREDYLIMLAGGDTSAASVLRSANRGDGLQLDIRFDYYGSKDFTRLFYTRISDQKAFLERGIRSVMFTSGITMNNNKPTDQLDSLNIPVLCRRVTLIWYWLYTYS